MSRSRRCLLSPLRGVSITRAHLLAYEQCVVVHAGAPVDVCVQCVYASLFGTRTSKCARVGSRVCVCVCAHKHALVPICRAGTGTQTPDLNSWIVFRPAPHSPVHLAAPPQFAPAQSNNSQSTANEARLRFEDPTSLPTHTPAGGLLPVNQRTSSAALPRPTCPVHTGSVRLENAPRYYDQRAGDRVQQRNVGVLHAQTSPSSARPPSQVERWPRHPSTQVSNSDEVLKPSQVERWPRHPSSQASNSDEVLKLKELCRQQALQAGFLGLCPQLLSLLVCVSMHAMAHASVVLMPAARGRLILPRAFEIRFRPPAAD